MTIGIIGAMDEEIDYLKQQMTETITSQKAGSLFIDGLLQEQRVVLVQSGIGKVNAAMTTTILHEQFKPSAIINTGTAGGFSAQLKVGDPVIGIESVHHDVDVTGFDYEIGQVPGMPERFKASKKLIALAEESLSELNIRYKMGLIATGDSFMNDPEKIQLAQERFPDMIAMEMEAAAIAQVCHQYETPFLIVRALSDIAGKEAELSFDEFVLVASENAANFIMKMLSNV